MAPNLRARTSATFVVTALLGALLVLASSPARAQSPDQTVRLEGADRFATAAKASESTFASGVGRVFLASGTTFADALGAGAIAGRIGAPVLLTTEDALPQPTRDELVRLGPDRVTVVGGSGVVSDSVVDQVRAIVDGTVDRIAGPDRHATAAALSQDEFEPGVPVAYVASGRSFADGLVAGAAAAAEGGPLLLAQPGALTTPTRDELARLGPDRIVVVGGETAISDAVVAELQGLTAGPVQRRSGSQRFVTAESVVASAFSSPVDSVVLATGADFPDALAGSALAASIGAPLLITRPDCAPAPLRHQLRRLDPGRLIVLGGTGAVSDAAASLVACDDGPPTARVIQTGLEVPWDVTFTPDGRTFLTERDSGRLLERRGDGSVREVATFDVDAAGEGGLLGLTHSPDYPSDGLLFTFLTTPEDNRVLRVRPDTGERSPILAGIPAASFHDAGRIVSGPDGMLWIGTGDAGVPQRSQDLTSLAGKILRITPTGATPADNPFDSPIWAVGFRDPQGLAFDADGRLYASEFGPDRDDEINLVSPGGNHAWGSEPGGQGSQPTGVTGHPDFVDPIVVRQPPVASWSGATVLVDGAIPEWEGDLFVAALRGNRLYRIDLDPASGGVLGVEELLVGEHGRLRHVARAPDGALWVLTSNCDGRGACPADGDRIVRIGPG